MRKPLKLILYRHGDSWAAKTLAGVTLALFTGVLAFFTFKIWQTANKLKQMEGDTSGLYENKDFWLKYSIFYDNYKKDFWWIFVPAIIYMFAKGCVLAAADGHGLAQTIAQLVIEVCSKGSLFFPYLKIPQLLTGSSAWFIDLESPVREKVWQRHKHLHPGCSSALRRLHSCVR